MVNQLERVPVNVRLLDREGVEVPVDCAYVGTDEEGLAVWRVLEPDRGGPWRGALVEVLPPRTSLILPVPGGAA